MAVGPGAEAPLVERAVVGLEVLGGGQHLELGGGKKSQVQP